MGFDYGPLGIGQVACLTLSRALILRSGDFGPHIVPRCLISTTIVTQQPEITQFIFGQALRGLRQAAGLAPVNPAGAASHRLVRPERGAPPSRPVLAESSRCPLWHGILAVAAVEGYAWKPIPPLPGAAPFRPKRNLTGPIRSSSKKR